MRIAYFDCASGISGDMILGTLVDLGVPIVLLHEAVRSLGVAGVRLETEHVERKGFRATLVNVIAPHEHVHRHLSTILEMIERSNLSDENKRRASEIFRRIAAAEAKAHGIDIEKVHFHEVGAIDSIADVVGAVVGLDFLGLDKILASPVPTGCGTVQIAHGRSSVPAPATAELLKGVPIAPSDVPFELTTPTGAAVLTSYAESYGPLPGITIRSIGIGAGSRDLEQQPNILRLIVGETNQETFHAHAHAHGEHHHEHEHHHGDHQHEHEHHHEHPHEHAAVSIKPQASSLKPSATETVWMVETNLDDLSGELVGYCVEKLWELGPLDVWTTPISMKKQRPGVVLSVLCRREQLHAVETVLFAETTTLGVRRWLVERTVLEREACQRETPWGLVDAKRAVLPDGTEKIAPEFESLRKIARENNVSLREVFQSLR